MRRRGSDLRIARDDESFGHQSADDTGLAGARDVTSLQQRAIPDHVWSHIGFLVKDGVALVAKMQADGMKVVSNGTDPQGRIYGGYIYSPEA